MESLVERLRALAEAYPVDVFPALTKEQTSAHPEIVTRASASMGRHFSKVFSQAADAIEQQTLNAERYRILRHKMTCGSFTKDEELAVLGAKDAASFDAIMDAMNGANA